MSKCERKVIWKFALETEKLMHSLYPIDRANKYLILFPPFNGVKIMNRKTSIVLPHIWETRKLSYYQGATYLIV